MDTLRNRTEVFVLHYVGQYSTARSDEHHSALNSEVIVNDPYHCQIHQNTSHQPNSEDGQQSTQDF